MVARNIFINALGKFYSVDELSELLREVEFEKISSKTLLSDVIGYHQAMKPLDK